MKCFFALGSTGRVDQFQYMALALAASARVNTALEMFCIYDGEPNAATARLQDLGVRVLFHKPLYAPMLKTLARRIGPHRVRHKAWSDPASWSGTFLRLEIPVLMEKLGFRDRFVLYIDADVFFQSDPELGALEPEYIAAAAESDPDDASFFNAGVMVLNVRSMVATYPSFLRFCMGRGFIPETGVLDQGLYNAFYEGKWRSLKPEYNWKAYWPPNPRASIVHFHGPKPAQIAAHREGKPASSTSKSIDRLLADHSAHLRQHLDVWNSWLERAKNPRLS